jgi:SpoVK/Ycf46/Vps4 family AAA+-type ATPase
LKARGVSYRKNGYRFDKYRYDLSLLNADSDIDTLVKNIQKSPVGNICMYGPSGTGKTAFAHFVAQELDMELVHKQAAELFGKYVGETEKNISAMFSKTNPQKQIIFLDEADSFFRSRESGIYEWQLTQVNQLLTSIEGFDGLCICSTNLIDNFDSASFRRFTVKIKFDYLTADQRQKMFITDAESYGLNFTESQQRKIKNMNFLTPGDFAAVRNKNRMLNNIKTADDLLEALNSELSCKHQTKQSHIGF